MPASATPIFGKALGLPPDDADGTVIAVRGVLAGQQPLPRSGEPEDIARAALWLASDDAGFVNGHALVVDGRMVAGRRWSTMRAAFERPAGEVTGPGR